MTSSVEQYNRLVFPDCTFAWGDYEALGVWAHLRVLTRTDPSEPWQSSPLFDFVTESAGLEYGYRGGPV